MEDMLVQESERRQSTLNLTSQGLRKQLGFEQSYLANVSPFLVFFWGANLALAAIICFVPLGSWRLGFALPLCGVLLGALVTHACLGLPLERRTGQAIAEAMRESPSDRMLLLMAFKSGKTVWFWLTLASVVLLAMTEPLLNWLRAERWGRWLMLCCITGGAIMLMIVGVICQVAVRGAIVIDLENRIAQLSKPKNRNEVLRLVQIDFVHRNDLPKLLPCLAESKNYPAARLLVLQWLEKRTKDLRKELVPKIERLIDDMLDNPRISEATKQEIRNRIETIRSEAK